VKTFLIASFIALSTLACGSGGLSVKSIESGSLAERAANLSESVFALVAQSSTAAEAVTKIDNYCQQNAGAIDRMKAESEGFDEAESEAFQKDLAKRAEAVQKRAEKALAGKEEVMADPAVLAAIFRCTPMGADDGGGSYDGGSYDNESSED